MTTYYSPTAVAALPPAQYAPAAAIVTHRPGTLAPGTKILVGQHKVVIEKYLSEGGFAHVYVVQYQTSKGTTEVAVLKRVAVPDKDALANMRTEVDTMKKLRGHAHIVTYIDSHASQLKGGGYEVFLLMEYCRGGGLIDFMNTRLKDRLTEPEILKIFSDVSEGVACMHYLKPALLHRDLKVENVLISSHSGRSYYKLCDFGSAANPRPAAKSAAEGRLIEDDVQRHTTLQYRSPEMVDVYRKRPIDEKSDIWALGVLLYKLCYYTTPFEEQGQMAILTASFKYPPYPKFSDRLKMLIASMLSEDPDKRPNIYQVLHQVCTMRGKEVPIKDIYSTRTESEARRQQRLPTPPNERREAASVGATRASPAPVRQAALEVTPMRRGRPTVAPRLAVAASTPESFTTPATSKDPFKALDSTSSAARAAAVDELSAKFPALEDFSLLQKKESGFEFNGKPSKGAITSSKSATQLADEVFAQAAKKSPTKSAFEPVVPAKDTTLPARSKTMRASLDRPRRTSPPAPRPKMVSSGTMTSPPTSPNAEPPIKLSKPPTINKRPVWRVPEPSTNVSRLSADTTPIRDARSPNKLDNRITHSEKPSVENMNASYLHVSDSLHRSRSVEISSPASRPSRSPYNNRSKSPGDERRATRTSHSGERPRDMSDSIAIEDTAPIESDVDFLRSVEEEGGMKLPSQSNHHRRKSSGILPNTRNILTRGVFSDAFKRFENTSSSDDAEPRPPSPKLFPSRNDSLQNGRSTPPPQHSSDPALSASNLNPNLNDNDINTSSPLDETEDLSPEMRREMERRSLSIEEKRVTDAAAAYRARSSKATGSSNSGGGKANDNRSHGSAIQARVKNLLDESGRAPPVKRTAEGYGRFTATTPTALDPIPPSLSATVSAPPAIPTHNAGIQRAATIATPQPTRLVPRKPRALVTSSTGRPSAPPKPAALRTASGVKGFMSAASSANVVAPSTDKSDAEEAGANGDRDGKAEETGGLEVEEVDVEGFSKRYPSLSLEMVEMEIAGAKQQEGTATRGRMAGLRIRDV